MRKFLLVWSLHYHQLLPGLRKYLLILYLSLLSAHMEYSVCCAKCPYEDTPLWRPLESCKWVVYFVSNILVFSALEISPAILNWINNTNREIIIIKNWGYNKDLRNSINDYVVCFVNLLISNRWSRWYSCRNFSNIQSFFIVSASSPNTCDPSKRGLSWTVKSSMLNEIII